MTASKQFVSQQSLHVLNMY